MLVSVAIAQTLIAVVNRRGFDVEPLLRESGLTQAQLANVASMIPAANYDRLVEVAYRTTQAPALGLETASQSSVSMLHVVGPLINSCSTLEDTFNQFQRYVPLIDQQGRYELVAGNEQARFVFTSGAALPLLRRFRAELCLGFLVRQVRELLPTPENATEILFRHPDPDYAQDYQRVFRCPIRFSREQNAICFPAIALRVPLPMANPRMNMVLQGHAEEALRTTAQKDVAATVRALLLRRASLDDVDAASVAKELAMAPRTLRRQLARANASFSELLDAARRELACRALVHADVSVKQLAVRLGFSEPSALRRAFRRWTGASVGEFRRGVGATKGS